jgi:DNA-binding protein Fis
MIHRNGESEALDGTPDMSLENMEKIHLSKVLKRLEWNKSKASKFLGISRATLRAKIKKYNLSDN